MTKLLPILVALLGLAGVLAAARAGTSSAEGPRYRLIAPSAAHSGIVIPNTPLPTPEPTPYQGSVSTIVLPSANLHGQYVVERRDTDPDLDGERLQEPTHPSRIAWYDRFGQPGTRRANTMFAAHVDYVRYGNGPFHDLTSARIGDFLRVIMDNGIEYRYSVKSVDVVHLDQLDMATVVYPDIAPDRERITLISCGGTLIPNPSGIGGEYNSRVVLVAERILD